jgi:hypothetical protein
MIEAEREAALSGGNTPMQCSQPHPAIDACPDDG